VVLLLEETINSTSLTENHWVSGLGVWFGIPNNGKHNVLESLFPSLGDEETRSLLSLLETANLNQKPNTSECFIASSQTFRLHILLAG
jgi:hypothetical protein